MFSFLFSLLLVDCALALRQERRRRRRWLSLVVLHGSGYCRVQPLRMGRSRLLFAFSGAMGSEPTAGSGGAQAVPGSPRTAGAASPGPASGKATSAAVAEKGTTFRCGKRDLRMRMRAVRRTLDAAEVERAGEAICNRVLELPEVRNAQALALYVALPGEVNLRRIIEECQRQGKSVLFPRFRAVDRTYEMVQVRNVELETVPGAFGIREPRPELPAAPLGLCRARGTAWVVPGLAFDGIGGRLGQGGGYYDRLLKDAQGVRIGVAFAWQLVPEAPTTDHDVPMDILVTEERVLRFSFRPDRQPA